MNILGKILLTSVLGFTLANATPHTLDNSHSEVGFSVKHLMITNVKGKFNDFKGVIDFDYKTKKFNKIDGTINANSIDTGIVKRDNHLRSDDFFDSTRNPMISFDFESHNPQTNIVKGYLNIKNIVKPIELKIEDLATIKDFEGNNRVGFTLKGEINRMDYDLKWNKALEFGGVAVGEKVKLIIEIQAVEN